MIGPATRLLPDGRLHLQHGPIDLLITAEGERETAFRAAIARFRPLLEDLVGERAVLCRPVSSSVQKYPGGVPQARGAAPPSDAPTGETARRMHAAAARHTGFVTPMAAVAGAVADTILTAMSQAARLGRAHVNNGGDIAIHLAPGTETRAAIAGLNGQRHGTVTIRAEDPIRGIATSGLGGRSLSMGIADSVTVLARSATEADVAATLVANAVDLPGHRAIRRAPARDLQPDSDLGARLVVTGCGGLGPTDIATALENGAARAHDMAERGLIQGAALVLRGQVRVAGRLAATQEETPCLT